MSEAPVIGSNVGGGSAAPSGAAGGDLTGTYPNPTIGAGKVTTAGLATGIPQSLTSSGSATKAIADTSAHVVGGTNFWNGTGWLGLGLADYYRNGANANIAETIPRQVTGAATAIAATGIMTHAAIVLYAGQVITNISFRVGAGATSPTHWFVALYDTQATPALIAQSADQTTTPLGASTNFTVALGSPAPYTVPTTGLYYASIMVASGGQPTLTGITVPVIGTNGAIVTGQKVIYQSSGSGLTTTAPGTIATPTTLAGVAYLATS